MIFGIGASAIKRWLPLPSTADADRPTQNGPSGSRYAATDPCLRPLGPDDLLINLACPLISEGGRFSADVVGMYHGLSCSAVVAASVPPSSGTYPFAHADLKGVDAIVGMAQDPRAQLITQFEDIAAAREAGKVGIIVHAQSPFLFQLPWPSVSLAQRLTGRLPHPDVPSLPAEQVVQHIETFREKGVLIMGLAYNQASLLAGGCQTSRRHPQLDRLTENGRTAVETMQRVGMIVDLSHVGRQSSLEALAIADKPMIFSHAACDAVHPHMRNITDDQIVMAAATEGVVGIPVLPYFIGSSRSTPKDVLDQVFRERVVPDLRRPELSDVTKHIDHVVDITGSFDHVALGLDYFSSIYPFASFWQQARDDAQDYLSGRWSLGDFGAPPHRAPRGIDTPAQLDTLAVELIRRYGEENAKKILCDNWMRVFADCWGAADVRH